MPCWSFDNTLSEAREDVTQDPAPPRTMMMSAPYVQVDRVNRSCQRASASYERHAEANAQRNQERRFDAESADLRWIFLGGVQTVLREH